MQVPTHSHYIKGKEQNVDTLELPIPSPAGSSKEKSFLYPV